MGEALTLLEGSRAVVLGGGTILASTAHEIAAAVVDLQALGLASISSDGDTVRVGAMACLGDLVASESIPAAIRDLARREAPNTIRNAATIGGTIGGNDPESELLAGLVAYRAVVSIERAGSSSTESLTRVLADATLLDGAIITEVGFNAGGHTVSHRTGRTPMDRPIVAVVAHRDAQGDVTLGITGVAGHVVEAGHTDLDELEPPADFRGSTAYRMHLARALTQRAIDDLNTGDAS